MNHSLARLYFHAGFNFAALLAILVLFLALKMTERYFEIRIDEHLDADFLRLVREGLLRRLDDPSLWALVSAALAGLWLLRASNNLQREVTTFRTSWMGERRGWLLWGTSFATGAVAYLLVVYLKHETFWYLDKPSHAIYAGTPIPAVQTMEGVANLVAILIATSLVPPSFQVLRQLEASLPKTSKEPLTLHQMKAGASLASMGLMPVSLLLFIAFNHAFIRFLFGQPVVDAAKEFATGSAAALFICWPMILITARCWQAKNRLSLHLSVLKALHLLIWPVCIAYGYRRLRPPIWITQPGCLARTDLRHAYELVNKLLSAGTLICAWYDPKFDAPQSGSAPTAGKVPAAFDGHSSA